MTDIINSTGNNLTGSQGSAGLAPVQPAQPAPAQPTPAQPAQPPEPFNPMASRPAEAPAQPAPAAQPETSDAHLEQVTSLSEFISNEVLQDKGSRLAVHFIETACAKLDQERAFGRAVETGNLDLIDVNYLQEKLGNAAQSVIEAAHFIAEQSANATERLHAELYAKFEGGEQTVQFAARHFNETATPEQKQLVRSLVDSGNKALMQHGLQLIVDAAKGIKPVATQQHFGAAPAVTPITRAEYGKLVLANPNMPKAELQTLRERLAAGLNR